MLEVYKTKLKGVLRIIPPTHFHDHRGDYIELYNELLYNESGVKTKFVQEDISISHKNVLRGIHGDNQTWKLISCLYGNLFLNVINLNHKSPEYKMYSSFVLEPGNYQVLIPPKFGNGHIALSEPSIFHYQQSTYYNRKKQFTVLWNNSELKLYWPIKDPILSDRDRGIINV